MALATVSWRAVRIIRRRRAEPAADWSAVDARADRPSLLATDGFFDAVVLASIVMFLMLAVGVAMLALQATALSWP
jgi:hypothetical protein